MDLRLLGTVFRRFFVLILIGLVLAVGLSVFSMAKVSSSGLTYRDSEIWSSSSILFLTQKGFPWGRVAGTTGTGYPALAGLTNLYAEFANSDAVKRSLKEHGAPATWKITAVPVEAANPYNGAPPLLSLNATASSATDAVKAAELGTSAFVTYVKASQEAAEIPLGQRIRIQTLQAATKPVLVQPRKKTVAVMVFLAVLTLTIGLALALENLRPRRPNEVAMGQPEPPVANPATWQNTA